MDIGAFVQENRRWLVGILVAVVVYFIAAGVIGSLYDSTAELRSALQLRRNAPDEMYTGAQVDELVEVNEALLAERERLQRALAFERRADFLLQPGSDAGEALFAAGWRVKQRILTGADERDVLAVEKDIAWQVSSQVDEIRQVLFGIELMDEVVARLFAAHDAVRAQDEEAMGLRSILLLRTEAKTTQRGRFQSRKKGEVDLEDLVEQQRVQFKFEADAATLARFFEACRQPGRALVVQNVRLAQPEQITDPVLVTGSLVGIAFKQVED